MTSYKYSEKIIIYSLLILWAFICLFPIFWTITTTFKIAPNVQRGDILPWIDFVPRWKGLRSLGMSPDTIFNESTVRDEFLKRFFNTFIISTCASSLAVFLGTTAAYGSLVVRITERMFRNEMSDAGCRFVAGVTGGWHNRSQKTSLNVFDTSGHNALKLQGVMKWIDNSAGEILAKGHNASDNMTVVLEADWLNQKIDGDLIFTQEANKAYRFFGEKRNAPIGGRILGAVGMCK